MSLGTQGITRPVLFGSADSAVQTIYTNWFMPDEQALTTSSLTRGRGSFPIRSRLGISAPRVAVPGIHTAIIQQVFYASADWAIKAVYDDWFFADAPTSSIATASADPSFPEVTITLFPTRAQAVAAGQSTTLGYTLNPATATATAVGHPATASQDTRGKILISF